MNERKYDLEERLIDFAVCIIKLANRLPNSKIGMHIQGQIVRSGSSPAPNYGEAQSAESRQDFIHKIKICLKELRETKIWLKIIKKAEVIKQIDLIDPILTENDELISILFKSAETAKKNLQQENTRKNNK